MKKVYNLNVDDAVLHQKIVDELTALDQEPTKWRSWQWSITDKDFTWLGLRYGKILLATD